MPSGLERRIAAVEAQLRVSTCPGCQPAAVPIVRAGDPMPAPVATCGACRDRIRVIVVPDDREEGR